MWAPLGLVVIVAAIALSVRWPALGLVIALGVTGLGVWGVVDWLATPAPHGESTGMEAIGYSLEMIFSLAMIAVGALWFVVALGARKRRAARLRGDGPIPIARVHRDA